MVEIIIDAKLLKPARVRQLLQEANHLRAIEVAERVAGQPQTNGRCFDGRWVFMNQCEDFLRSERRCNECARANKITTGKGVLHKVNRRISPDGVKTSGVVYIRSQHFLVAQYRKKQSPRALIGRMNISEAAGRQIFGFVAPLGLVAATGDSGGVYGPGSTPRQRGS